MELRTEIEIEREPAVVWAALVDFDRYGEWNPFISVLSGVPKVGARLTLEFTLADGKSQSYRPRVTALDPGRELRFAGHYFVKGLLDSEHFILLKAGTEGGTRVVNGAHFSGRLVKIMGPALAQMARGFVYMNQALRRRVTQT